MERPTPSRSRRSERLAHSSPYARASPASKPSQALTAPKKSAATPFSTLRSMFSYVASPFIRSSPTLPSHMSDLNGGNAMDVDSKSESGSEDGWNGQAPAGMSRKDMFDLAAAGGRQGDAFDQRAVEWRQKPGNEGRNLPAAASSSSSLQPKATTMPGQLFSLKSTPSLPKITASSSPAPLKRIRSPPLSTPFTSRAPLPSFLPSAIRPTDSQATYVSTTASKAALDAYLDAKRGQDLTPEDLGIIETLSRNARAESSSGDRSPKEYVKMGGWTAGSYAGTPRPIKALRGSRFGSASPAPSSPASPGSAEASFSTGVAEPLNASPAQRRIRYLGPGMSPRRMLGRQRTGMRPLFDADLEAEEAGQTPPKKRRTDQEISLVDEDNANIQSPSAPLPVPKASAPWLNRLTSVPKSSPLGKTVTSPVASPVRTKEEAVAEGKRRAADIMKELLEEEIGPLEDKQTKPEFILINPYDTPRPESSGSASPSSLIRSVTPGGSRALLRSSLRGQGTPSRGAAARLEANRSGRKLTTIELLEGKHLKQASSTPSKSANGYADTPGRDEDMQDVEALFDTPAPMKLRSTKKPRAAESVPPAAPQRTEEPPVKPFETPSLYTSGRAAPKPAAGPAAGKITTFDSPSAKAVLDAAERDKAQPRPVFKPSAAAPTADADEDEPMLSITPSKSAEQRSDPASVFLSAKDSALKVAKAALPFFTFTLSQPAAGLKLSGPSEAVRAAVLAREPPSFTFTLADVAPKSITDNPLSKAMFKLPTPATTTGTWKCSLCDLQNPGSAKEKCTICETPRPGAAAASAAQTAAPVANGMQAAAKPPAPTTGFNWAAAGGAPKKAAGGWTCGECMLSNPESATDKCTICEAPRR